MSTKEDTPGAHSLITITEALTEGIPPNQCRERFAQEMAGPPRIPPGRPSKDEFFHGQTMKSSP